MFGRTRRQIAFLALLLMMPPACLGIFFQVQNEQWQYDHPGQRHLVSVAAAVVLFFCAGLSLHIVRENARLAFGTAEVVLSVTAFYAAVTNTDNIMQAMTSEHFSVPAAFITVIGLSTVLSTSSCAARTTSGGGLRDTRDWQLYGDG